MATLTTPSCSFTVDKSKPKASARQQTPQRPTTLPRRADGPPDVVPGGSGQRRAQVIQQLKGLLAASHCRFEALAVVLQHWVAKVGDNQQTGELTVPAAAVCTTLMQTSLSRGRPPLPVCFGCVLLAWLVVGT